MGAYQCSCPGLLGLRHVLWAEICGPGANTSHDKRAQHKTAKRRRPLPRNRSGEAWGTVAGGGEAWPEAQGALLGRQPGSVKCRGDWLILRTCAGLAIVAALWPALPRPRTFNANVRGHLLEHMLGLPAPVLQAGPLCANLLDSLFLTFNLYLPEILTVFQATAPPDPVPAPQPLAS